MLEQPLITVITPSFQQGKFIEDCLLSVKNQTYKHLEHIVLDACSSDETDAVIKTYLGSYNLIYLREKDTGQANAINKGFDMAQGEIVCWLNADDFYINSLVLEKVVTIFLFSTLNIDVVVGDGYYVDTAKKTLYPIFLNRPKLASYQFIKHTDPFLQPSTFWKKNPIRLDENLHYAFDWKFFIDLYKHGFSFYYAREYYSCYRIHDSSKTCLDNARRRKEIIEVLKYNQASSLPLGLAYLTYWGYVVAEKTGLPVIKRIFLFLNSVLKVITGDRV